MTPMQLDDAKALLEQSARLFAAGEMDTEELGKAAWAWAEARRKALAKIRRAIQAMLDGAPLASWDFTVEDVEGLLQERDAAVAQLVNAIAPVMAGAKQAQETLERNAIDAAAEWARAGGYSRAEVSGLVGAIYRALHPKVRP